MKWIAMLIIMTTLPQVQAQNTPSIVEISCASCHGQDGNSAEPLVPKIAGKDAAYITKQLRDFALGQRRSDVMTSIAAALSADEISALSIHFSTQKPQPGKVQDARLAEMGRALYEDESTGYSAQACTTCHQSTGVGNARFPRLAGQHQAYTLQQLANFKSGRRANSPQMVAAAKRLSQDDMKALSEYIAGL